MFDEEGRKIDLGYQIGMDLTSMSVDELNAYLTAMDIEAKRVGEEINRKKASANAADAFFK